MAEINANFVVQPFGITVTPDAPGISVTATPTNLNVYSLGYAQPSGNVGELQFNLNGQVLGGAANTLASNGNVRFTNISNLKINGGANAYFLQTDGTGNLTWAQGTANVSGNGTAAGANTQIQISDGTGNFTSAAGFTFDNATNLFSTPGNVFIAGNANIVGNIANANITNALVGNTANFNGNVSANYFIGNGSQLTGIDPTQIQNGTANVRTFLNSNVTISAGGVANTVVASNNLITFNTDLNFNGNGAFGNQNLQVNYLNANFVTGVIQTAQQPNITLVGVLSNLFANGLIFANGNIQANTGYYFVGDAGYLSNVPTGALMANGNSNVRIATANGNITMSVAGNANIVTVTGTGANISGTLDITSNLTINGNTISNGAIFANSGQIRAQFMAANTANITGNLVTGNANLGNAATANFFIGSGNNLSNIQGANVTGAVANATHSSTANTVVDAAQPNITSVGNLSSLQIATNGNITLSGSLSFISGANFVTATTVNANALVGNYVESANIFTENVGYFTTQIALSNSNLKIRTAAVDRLDISNTLASFSVPISGTVLGPVANGNSNLSIPVANGNVTISAAGNANILTVTGNGANIAGTFDVTGNISAGNSSTDVSSANIFSGPLFAYFNEQIELANGNIKLYASGNDRVIISNTIANFFVPILVPTLRSDNLQYANGTPYSFVPAGSNTQIQFNTNNALGASANLTFDSDTNNLTVNGNIIANTITGTLTTNAQPNITSVGTLTGLTVSNTISGSVSGSAGTAATVTSNSQPNITSVGTLTNLSVSGNITASNANLGNIVTGNTFTGTANTANTANLANVANFVSVSNSSPDPGGPHKLTFVRESNNDSGNRIIYFDGGGGGGSLLFYPNTDTLYLSNIRNIDRISNGDSTNSFIGVSNSLPGPMSVNFGANGNITGYFYTANSTLVCNVVVANSTVGGTLTTAAQPNITSVGNLTSLNVSGNTTSNNYIANNYVKITTTTVANLGNAVTLGAGTKSFVTDANTTTFNAIVGGGGANNIPVFSDGTDWRVG